jgi:predicted esterase
MKVVENAAAVTLEPERAATAAVIWLHGLGADGHDFVPIVPCVAASGDAQWWDEDASLVRSAGLESHRCAG